MDQALVKSRLPIRVKKKTFVIFKAKFHFFRAEFDCAKPFGIHCSHMLRFPAFFFVLIQPAPRQRIIGQLFVSEPAEVERAESL